MRCVLCTRELTVKAWKRRASGANNFNFYTLWLSSSQILKPTGFSTIFTIQRIAGKAFIASGKIRNLLLQIPNDIVSDTLCPEQARFEMLQEI